MMRFQPIAFSLGVLLLAGCAGPQRSGPIEVWPDMDRQEKYKAQTESALFSDGRSNRRPVEGTVAVGHLKEDTVYTTGVENGQWIGKSPVAVSGDLLKRGQQRYNIYCSPCHDRTGQGQGIVPKKATWIPTNLMEERVAAMPDGEIYSVISHGRRSMPGYKYQVVEADRWAIVAYVRALQRSSLGTVEDVPSNLRSELR
jgi:mono/diheme cytochrome c family protein